MDKRALAEQDWLNGMKAREIAEKHEVNASTVRSWISRYWKPAQENGVATKVSQQGKGVATRKTPSVPYSDRGQGAPFGNTNAKGNKGGGGTLGNTNAMTHGAYSEKYAGLITSEKIKDILEHVGSDSEIILEHKIRDLQIQENYFIGRISKLTGKYPSDVGIKDISKTTNGTNYTTTTRTTALDDLLKPLYDQLDRVQKLLVRTVKELELIRNNRIKLGINGHLQKSDPFDDLTLEEIKALMLDD